MKRPRPLSVGCPVCRCYAGQRCRSRAGRFIKTHAARVMLAQGGGDTR